MSEPISTPESESEQPHLRHPILDWSASLALLALFIAALIFFPPITAAGNPPPVSKWMLFFGRFHPIFVHLPIGVMIMAIIMEIVAMAKHRVANALRPAITFTLGCGVFGLVTAVTFGILLSREGGFDAATIQAHQTLGIAATIAAFLALFTKLVSDGTGKGAFIYRTFLAVSFLVLSVGAHFGGNMSHGDNYLTEYADPSVRLFVKKYEGYILKQFEPAASPTEEPNIKRHNPIPPAPVLAGSLTNKTVFVALVTPILEKKCNSCHNAQKTKGKLRMETYELLLKGGANGDTVVPGDPDKSLLISRISLPKDDDDHMPPSGKDQISQEEISLLAWWIKNGASKTMTVAQAASKLPPELHTLEQSLLRKSGSTGSTPPHLLIASAAAAAQVNPAVAEAMRKINGSGASLAPVGADPTQLRFTALNVARDYTDENLKDLTPILDNIVALDLAKTKVTDGSIALISKMPNLRELHLENTAVTDAGVAQLKVLKKLEYLNLYGTKVTDKALDVVGEIASLKSLYLWQTGVTKPKADAFKAAHPAINVNIGWNEADAAKVVATAPKPEAKPAPAVPAKPAEAPKPAAAAAAPAKPAAAAAPASTPGKPLDPNAVAFKSVIMPILEEKCIACHGPKKSKGKLRMDSYAAILKGGSDGADTVIPSKPADSLMVKRTALPVDDDDHMPPKDEKQLSKDEIALLKWWVETGASETATLASLKKTPEIDAALTAFAATPHAKGAASETASKESEKPKAKPLTPEEKKIIAGVTAKMTALNASLMPLALDTELLRFSCVNGADKIGDKELALLEPAAAWIVWVDLGKTKVTDAGLASIAKMKNLEKLHLEKTAVTDAGLATLAALPHLEYLNLYGTKVTDAGIAKLAPDKGLKKLFVWETAVTHEGAKKLEASVPGLVVNVGLSEADIAKLIEQNKPPEPPPAAKKPDAKAAAKPAAKPAAPAPATKPAAPAPAPAAARPPPAPAPATPKPDDKK